MSVKRTLMRFAIAVSISCLLLPGPCSGIHRNHQDSRLSSALTDGIEAYSKKIAVDTADGQKITAIQWSAHWKCFIDDTCKDQAKATLGNFLAKKPDFMNLGMYQVNDAFLQKTTNDNNYGKQVHWCSRDDVTLLWNSDVWELVKTDFANNGGTDEQKIEGGVPTYTQTPFSKDGAPGVTAAGLVTGCFELNGDTQPDRAFIIGLFKRTGTEDGKDDFVTVVGAHFPHPPGGTSSADVAVFVEDTSMKQLGLAIKMMKTTDARVGEKVVIIADTNWDDVTLDADAEVESEKKIDGESFKLGPYDPKGLTAIRVPWGGGTCTAKPNQFMEPEKIKERGLECKHNCNLKSSGAYGNSDPVTGFATTCIDKTEAEKDKVCKPAGVQEDGRCVMASAEKDKASEEDKEASTHLRYPFACSLHCTSTNPLVPVNQEQPTKSSPMLWEEMQLEETFDASAIQATEPMGTCCADQIVPKDRKGVPNIVKEEAGQVFYPFAFDRVLTNFGNIETSMPFKDATIVTPDDFKNMQVGAQHNPIQADITYV